jgi:hypothetical protein
LDAGGGAGFGDGGPGDDVSADAIERELQQEANVELHATAQSVVGILEAKIGDGSQSNVLSKEDKETINLVIPADLSPDEIENLRKRLAALGSATSQDLVTTVIEAMQQMRPFGNQRIGPAADPKQPTLHDDAQLRSHDERPRTRNTRARQSNAKQKKASDKTMLVDLEGTLRTVIKADSDRHVTIPEQVQFAGFRARVVRHETATLPWGTADGTLRHYIVAVTIMPLDAPSGMRGSRGAHIKNGEPIDVTVEVSAP